MNPLPPPCAVCGCGCVCGCRGGGVEPPTKFSKMGGGEALNRIARISIFREGLLGKRGDFFQEGFQLLLKPKKKQKSEIFNDEKRS